MFENVIVGVDGGEGGRDAIALAKNLSGEGGALTLAYIYPLEPRAWRGTTKAYDEAERKRATDLMQRAEKEAGVQARLRVHGTMSVGRGLHELAHELGADLVVIGSNRRGLLGRVFVGDDTRTALDGAPSAVAIASAGYAHDTPTMREIGVGYDGSAESEQAVAVARKLAAAHGAKLSALQAIFHHARLDAGHAWHDHGIEDKLAAARERVAGLGGVEPHAAYGEPAEELALYSGSLDLLVIGSRSYGPIGRLVHGSTAHKLAHSARSPLLVLTRGARQTNGASTDEQETAGAANAAPSHGLPTGQSTASAG